jgi:hypothetical protein
MVFYRYENTTYCGLYGYLSTERIEERRYYLIKETPCGWWIHSNRHHNLKGKNKMILFHTERPHWVSKTSRKKFAYPTQNEALEGFKARKRRQITILEHKLMKAQAAIRIAENGDLSRTLPLGSIVFEFKIDKPEIE